VAAYASRGGQGWVDYGSHYLLLKRKSKTYVLDQMFGLRHI